MEETQTPNSANHQIARAAGTIMLAFVLSNVVGLVRQILILRVFGTSSEMDAYNAASTIPDLLFYLVAGGALASAFIPTFTDFLTKEDRLGAWKLASSIANLVTLTLTLFSAVAAIFAPFVVRNILYSLSPDLDPALESLTISLLRILLLTPTIFGLSGLLMGILNTHQKFWLPALAPTMYWVGMIFGVIFLSPTMGIFGLVWGAVLGALGHLCIQLPDLLKLPFKKYFTSLGLKNPSVLEVGQLMGPRIIGVAVVRINFVINAAIATSLAAGSLTSITVAFMVMTMPQVAIAQAIAIAALPTFSAQVARGEINEMRSSLASTMRGVLLLAFPAMMGLILLREQIVALFFQHGNFTSTSTDMVAWALLWYSVGLIGHSMVEILVRAFYALHDTKTPVTITTIAMLFNIVFSFAFAALFSKLGWMPHGGLALANSLATMLEMTGLFILMRRRLKGINGSQVASGFFQAAFGSVIMSAVLFALLGFFGNISVWILVLVGIAAGGLVYAAIMFALRVPELTIILNAVHSRLRKVN